MNIIGVLFDMENKGIKFNIIENQLIEKLFVACLAKLSTSN